MADGYQQAGALLGGGLQGHGQDPLDGTGLAGQGQLADDGERARPVKRDLPTAQEQAQRDRQVEPAGVFLQVGRGQVDHDPIDRPAVSRIDDRPLDPVRALLDGSLGQAHQHRLGSDEKETSTSTSTGVASMPTSVYDASFESIREPYPAGVQNRSGGDAPSCRQQCGSRLTTV